MNVGWKICDNCKGKGCWRCNHMGRKVENGFVICSECKGFGTINPCKDDPLDMGSFVEECDKCDGGGVIPERLANGTND